MAEDVYWLIKRLLQRSRQSSEHDFVCHNRIDPLSVGACTDEIGARFKLFENHRDSLNPLNLRLSEEESHVLQACGAVQSVGFVSKFVELF